MAQKSDILGYIRACFLVFYIPGVSCNIQLSLASGNMQLSKPAGFES